MSKNLSGFTVGWWNITEETRRNGKLDSLSRWPTPRTPPLGVGATRASGLDLTFNPLWGRTAAVGGTEILLSSPLWAGVLWCGATSTFFRGVDLAALRRSASESFLGWVDSERRPTVEDTGGAVDRLMERSVLLLPLEAAHVELLRLRFTEEFTLPARGGALYC